MKLSPKNLDVLALTMLFALTACGKKKDDSSPANLPLVKPPVEAATPPGLLTGTGTLALDGLSSSDIKARLFSSGPTTIMGILAGIDTRIKDINSMTANSHADCVTQAPVAYTITPFGQTVTMYGQCWQKLSGPQPSANDPQLLQFGIKDGVAYIYVAIGAGPVAAIVTPVSGADGKYQVQAWMGVGVSNNPQWDSMSYGVIQIQADSNANSLEAAMTGINFGYCGVQLKSDGSNIFVKGSADEGFGCGAVADLCVAASDAMTAGTCSTALKTFALSALGRAAAKRSDNTTWPASLYPATPTITLNGTNTDTLYFGPQVPTAGLGDIGAQQ